MLQECGMKEGVDHNLVPSHSGRKEIEVVRLLMRDSALTENETDSSIESTSETDAISGDQNHKYGENVQTEESTLSRHESGHVLLVTRPSLSDMERWTERATSQKARSASNNMQLLTASHNKSQNWLLEYKPVVSHSGWLIKRGHSIRNYKRRLFCLLDHELVYHDTHESTEVRGRVDLGKPTTVHYLLHSGFQLTQGSYQMILYASDAIDRDVWIKKLQEQGVELIATDPKTTKLIEQQNTHAEIDSIILSGWLRKRGQMVKSTKRRWFELSQMGILSYYSHPQGGTKKGSIELLNAQIAPSDDTLKRGKRFSFRIRTGNRDLILYADSQEDRSLWVSALNALVEGMQLSSPSTSTPGGTPNAPPSLDLGKRCSCNSSFIEADGAMPGSLCSTASEGYCRRCISKSEDALADARREIQLILSSPYSPEGSTTAAFIKEHVGKSITTTVLRQFMSGLADYMVSTRLKELRTIAQRSNDHVSAGSEGMIDVEDDDGDEDGSGNEDETTTEDDSSECTEKILELISQQIEERVLFPLLRGVLITIKAQIQSESKIFRGKIEVLRSKSQSFFGVSPQSISISAWHNACVQLKMIDKLSLPYMKRDQLLQACREIYAVYHEEHPLNAPMNADEFIPAFIYVLVQSNLSDPILLKEMVTQFEMGTTQGETAYFVTCLEIAIEYIRSLLTACTVVLDATQMLGIEFIRDQMRQVIVVNNLIAGGPADHSGAVYKNDVLIAVNGLLVIQMPMDEVTKMIKSVEGDVELCFLSLREYDQRYGTLKIPVDNDDIEDPIKPPLSHSPSITMDEIIAKTKIS